MKDGARGCGGVQVGFRKGSCDGGGREREPEKVGVEVGVGRGGGVHGDRREGGEGVEAGAS